MASVLGNFNINTTSGSSGVSDSSIALIGALSTATASATSDLLGPALDRKAPTDNPIFTGTVLVRGDLQCVNANMIQATDPRTATPSNVQTQINNMNSFIVSVDGKADKLDTRMTGSATLQPKAGQGNDTQFTIRCNGIGSTSNRSVLNLQSQSPDVTTKLTHHDLDGATLDTKSALKLRTANRDMVLVSGLEPNIQMKEKLVCGKNLAVVGVVDNALRQEQTLPGRVSEIINTNTNATGASSVKLLVGSGTDQKEAILQLNRIPITTLPLLPPTPQLVMQLTTKDPIDFVISNPTEAMRVKATTKVTEFLGETDCKTLAINKNPWFEKRITSWQYKVLQTFPGLYLSIPWQYPSWAGTASFADKGTLNYVAPGTSLGKPWWDSANNLWFNIQKTWVYWFKALLVLDFDSPWGLNEKDCEIKLRMLPDGKTDDIKDGVTKGSQLSVQKYNSKANPFANRINRQFN